MGEDRVSPLGGHRVCFVSVSMPREEDSQGRDKETCDSTGPAICLAALDS